MIFWLCAGYEQRVLQQRRELHRSRPIVRRARHPRRIRQTSRCRNQQNGQLLKPPPITFYTVANVSIST